MAGLNSHMQAEKHGVRDNLRVSKQQFDFQRLEGETQLYYPDLLF